MTKIAVVLLNLGGPDSKESIEPFLFNFFMDGKIIRLPLPLRWPLAKLISKRRSKREAGASYGELGGKSPLLANTQVQADALEKNLNMSSRRKPGSESLKAPDPVFQRDDSIIYKVFVCMRYWHPMADEMAHAVKEWGAEKIVLLPLYPQFSTTTTCSAFGAWEKARRRHGLTAPESRIHCYPEDRGFIRASAENIRAQLEQARRDGHGNPRILFSAHGLPESVIAAGDPYQQQCEQTARAIVQALGIPDLDWAMCYQSRVGPQKWIGPSTEEEIARTAREGKAVIIYPHAFTQEHVETLVELDIEYRHKAEEWGIAGYYRASTVGTHPAFIDGLAALVQSACESEEVADGRMAG